MSKFIMVSPSKAVDVYELLPRIRDKLKVILGLTFEPILHAEVNNGEANSGSGWVDPSKDHAFILRVNDIEQITRVLSSTNKTDFFIVLPRRSGCAVGAATAIALAEHFGSQIDDSEGGLTKEGYLSPSELLQRIKLDGPYDKMEEATQAFEAK